MSVVETKTGEEYVVVSANTTITMISGLHPDYTYICSVAAYTIGLGPYSDTITVTLEEASKYLIGGINFCGKTVNFCGIAAFLQHAYMRY